MKRRATVFLPGLLAAALVALILPAKLAHGQSKVSADKKDQEIELLKAEVKQLEQRVNTLESLNGKVKTIDSKLEAQSVTQQVQTDSERTKALESPIVRAGEQGFRLQSANDDYRIRFALLTQINGRFFTSGNDKNSGSTF